MKIIITKNQFDLKDLIDQEIKNNGINCDLNHIDIRNVTDLGGIFANSCFNGDISQWDTSHATNMSYMFSSSKFNGDISKWNVSNVTNTQGMFADSFFNQDISNWNISKVENMIGMFQCSKFNGDISLWKPYLLKYEHKMLEQSLVDEPYWKLLQNLDDRKKIIDAYHLNLKLEIKNSKKSRKI